MAKIIIAGNVFVVTSSHSLESIKLLEKYRPDALILKDDKGEPVFKVGTGTNASINKNGVCFNAATHDDQKLACMTFPIPPDTEDAKNYTTEFVGQAISDPQNN